MKNVKSCLFIWRKSENLVKLIEQLKKFTENCEIQTENIQRLYLGNVMLSSFPFPFLKLGWCELDFATRAPIQSVATFSSNPNFFTPFITAFSYVFFNIPL